MVLEVGGKRRIGYAHESLKLTAQSSAVRFVVPANLTGTLYITRLVLCRDEGLLAAMPTPPVDRGAAKFWVPIGNTPFAQAIPVEKGKAGPRRSTFQLTDGVYYVHAGLLVESRGPQEFACPFLVGGWVAPRVEKTTVNVGANDVRLRVVVRNEGTGQFHGAVSASIQKPEWMHVPPDARQQRGLPPLPPGGAAEIELAWKRSDLAAGSYRVQGFVDHSDGFADPGTAFETEPFVLGEKTTSPWPGKDILTLAGHTAYVTCVAFSPDGKRIVSGSLDGAVKVWDAVNGRETLTFNGRKHVSDDSGNMSEWINCIAVSPDSKLIANAIDDGTIHLRGTYTGREFPSLRGHGGFVESVAFSPDGTKIVGGTADQIVAVWDIQSGKQILRLKGHTGYVNGVAFSPDGKTIVSGGGGGDNTLKLWDAAGERETVTLKGHNDGVSSVAFSPDGARIVSSSFDRTIKLWDAANAAEVLTLAGHSGSVGAAAFSPDGKRIVSGSDDTTVKVWDASSGKCLFTFEGHGRRVSSVAFSPDGLRIASSGSMDAAYRGYILVITASIDPTSSRGGD
jgi:hypothetical protein